jgi:Zn-dependent peptidase ImmA (M78 family)
MTQKVLAEASNTSQSSISRAEAGVDRPSQAAVDAWASVLRYEASLFQEPDSAVLPRTPLFRRRAALKKADVDATAALLHIRCRQVEAMARAVETPEESVPKINLDKEGWSVAEAAQWVRAKWKVPAGPIENMARLLEDHGIVVARLGGVGDGFMGISIVDPGHHPILLVSSDAPGCRDRWTLAHELGHVVLHHHRDNDVLEDCEEEADQFAGEFLAPAHDIRHQFPARLGLADLAQLKRHWRISMQALIGRARQVRKITDAQETRLWKLISARGYRRQEPVDVGVDEAEVINEMVRVHLEELGFSVKDLSKTLWLQPEEFRQVFLRGADIDVPAQTDSPQPAAPGPRLRLVD